MKEELLRVAFLYPYDTTENVKVGEALQKYNLHVSNSNEGLVYSLDEQRERIKYSFIVSSVSGRNVNIMAGVEKRGMFTSVPVEAEHLLWHITSVLKSL
ncbi:hypothetical protein [Acidianus sp. HS-5]|uniref:hypothetical protein n=1 Tax=Acidianus sp. HS-5 TaxID=2886040 RepID=UPI001F17066A|nr:hypothetical protein [Acidianus sp. HS-5]BDC17472.1 hypothetical protein HS5_03620 [Acidianus sp. HS-5]